ncbi:MAG: FecR family protein, partial [Planctomycetota bacterium]
PAARRRTLSIWRRGAALAAAAAALLAVGLYLHRGAEPVAPPLIAPPAVGLEAELYRPIADPATSTASAAAVTPRLELAGFQSVQALDGTHRAVATGDQAGEVVALFDPTQTAGTAVHRPIARIALDANTSVQFYGPGETIPGATGAAAGPLPRGGVVLQHGALLADVTKAGSRFEVLTPGAGGRGFETVEVHGTRFFVRADGRSTAVDVLEGLVEYIPATATTPAALSSGEPASGELPSEKVDLPAGACYTRDLAAGTATLQRADPSDIFFPFAPRQLAVSAWPQAGGGLERGNAGPAPFFTAYRLDGTVQPDSTARFRGPLVVLPDGRFLAVTGSGAHAGLRLLTVTPGAGALGGAAPPPGDGAQFDVLSAPAGAAPSAGPSVEHSPLGGVLHFGPVLLPREVVAVVVDHRLVGLSTVTWQPVWKDELPGDTDIYALSVGPRGRAILSTSQGLNAYDGATGAPVWDNRDVGEITSGIAATECADQPFLLAFDSIHARIYKLSADGALLKTIDLRAAVNGPGGLAEDIKDWTLASTPILIGGNCVLVFEDGATALVNLTTGARRMTDGLGAQQHVRLVSLDPATLNLTMLLESGAAYRCDLSGSSPELQPFAPGAAAHIDALAMTANIALTVDPDGTLRLWRKP